jgi:CPA2 family monovalent cation:H+ antiporter-2
MHDHAFLLSVGVALAAALVGGFLARLIRLPPLIGYLLAGIVIGPYTPGIIADKAAVEPVANLGVVLLMFAVGLQFSMKELLHVRRTALIAGGVQILGTIGLGLIIGIALKWSVYGSLFLGCAIALSSTAVLMRILEDRGEVGAPHGAIMLGIAVVQDLSLILMVALLPSLGPGQSGDKSLFVTAGMAALKAATLLIVAIMLAQKVVPFVLRIAARAGSRELFVLAVIVLCLGAAIGAELTGLGMPLGAFLAGMVVSESDYAHEVLSQVRPLRDIFSSLFFVSVGMLLDLRFFMNHWPAVMLVVFAIVIGKMLLTAIPVWMLGWHGSTAIRSGTGLAQIGEFSFVLATMGSSQGLIPVEISSVILTSALVTLLLAPLTYQIGPPLNEWLEGSPKLSNLMKHGDKLEPVSADHSSEKARVIVLGYGRVGRYVSDALLTKGISHVIVDLDSNAIERCKLAGAPVVYGDASSHTVLERVGIKTADLVVITLPDVAATIMATRAIREVDANVPIIARLHRGVTIPEVRKAGATAVVHAEFEAGTEMIRQGLGTLGLDGSEIETYIADVRQHRYRNEEDMALIED